MELGNHIKELRNQHSMSQDDLAYKIYVSRQTISNWENNKNYPDIKSLLLLSSLFDVSLDQLVKGDLKEMKDMISTESMSSFKKESRILTVLFLVMVLSAGPLFIYGKWIGLGIWSIIVFITMYYAYRIEKYKKSYDIKTYKEIVRFLDGKPLTEQEKQQEIGKRNYQVIFLAIGGALVAGAIMIGFILLIESIL